MLELLLRHGADLAAVCRPDTWTPLHSAASHGALAPAQLLLDLGEPLRRRSGVTSHFRSCSPAVEPSASWLRPPAGVSGAGSMQPGGESTAEPFVVVVDYADSPMHMAAAGGHTGEAGGRPGRACWWSLHPLP